VAIALQGKALKYMPNGRFIQMDDSYIHCYNEKRIKMSLGSRSPLEYRESSRTCRINQPNFSAAAPLDQLSTGVNSRHITNDSIACRNVILVKY